MKVISPVLFAMLVIMALATTLATAPNLRLIMGNQLAYDKDAGFI